MKLQRPGYTESGLCFLDYLKNNLNQTEEKYELFLMKWLFSTSGFYDYSIKSYDCNFNVEKFQPYNCSLDIKEVQQSLAYNTWLKLYKKSLIHCEHLIFCLHKHKVVEYKNIVDEYVNQLDCLQNIKYKHFWTWHENLYDLIADKKILIINGMSDIICHYYNTGQTHKHISNFPKIETISLQTGYSFFNVGGDNNAIETLEKTYDKICKINFDIALVSYGSYGCILVDMISKKLGKKAVTMGSGLSKMFGVKNIKISESLLPDHYHIIESGRYWNFK